MLQYVNVNVSCSLLRVVCFVFACAYLCLLVAIITHASVLCFFLQVKQRKLVIQEAKTSLNTRDI